MNSRSCRPLLVGVSVLLTLVPAQLRAQGSEATETAPSAAEELASVLRELRELRAGYYVSREQLTDRIANTRASVQRFEGEVATLEAERDASAKSVADLEAELAELEAAKVELTATKSKRGELFDVFRQAAERHVRAGLPYRVDDRLAQIEAIGEASSIAEAAGLAWSFFEEEMRIARSGEAYTADVPLGGDRLKPARLARVGLHILVFVTEDGADVGVWRRDRGWTVTTDENVQESIRTAVEILDRRGVPAHISLPIDLGEGAK